MDFLSRSKTERLAVANIIEIAKANGYVEFDPTEMYQPCLLYTSIKQSLQLLNIAKTAVGLKPTAVF